MGQTLASSYGDVSFASVHRSGPPRGEQNVAKRLRRGREEVVKMSAGTRFGPARIPFRLIFVPFGFAFGSLQAPFRVALEIMV